MSDLVGNPEDRFSRIAFHIIATIRLEYKEQSLVKVAANGFPIFD